MINVDVSFLGALLRTVLALSLLAAAVMLLIWKSYVVSFSSYHIHKLAVHATQRGDDMPRELFTAEAQKWHDLEDLY